MTEMKLISDTEMCGTCVSAKEECASRELNLCPSYTGAKEASQAQLAADQKVLAEKDKEIEQEKASNQKLREHSKPNILEVNKKMPNLWTAEWHGKNKLDGERKHIIYSGLKPVIFLTRQECRDFIHEKYGYIKTRPDLRAEPHGWKMPRPIKVKVVMA